METLIGLIIFGLVSFFTIIGRLAEQKQKQEAAERQRKQTTARQQQQDAAGRDTPKKKFKQIEQPASRQKRCLAGVPADDLFVVAESVSSQPQKRESVFDEAVDGAAYNTEAEPSGLATDTAPTARQLSEHANPIAQEIMALMTTPQSMQQVVILSEIFHRPKYE